MASVSLRFLQSRSFLVLLLALSLLTLASLWSHIGRAETKQQLKQSLHHPGLHSPALRGDSLRVSSLGKDPETSEPVQLILSIHPPVTEGEVAAIQECGKNFPKFSKHNLVPLIPFMNDLRFRGLTFLNQDSTVVEVGGYTGVDAEKILSLYNPNYHILEPVPEYFKQLQAKFGNSTKVKLYDFGLGKETKNLTIHTSVDGTSVFAKNSKGSEVSIQIRNATEFFTSLGLPAKPLDMLQLNCEGCEFELLEVLLESGLISAVRRLVVQFHFGLAGLERLRHRYCALQTLLLRSHQPSWLFRFTWQQWELAV